MSNQPELIVPTMRVEKSRPYAPPASSNGGGSDSVTIMQIVERMLRESTFDFAKVQQMLDLKERWERDEARKAFTVAMSAFKADPPKIVKNKHVMYRTDKGVTEYDHATHSEVTEKIAAGLGVHGLYHRWNVEQLDGGKIRVTCVVAHSLGHSESVAMTALADDSGRKNSIQAIASTVTYLQRYTLLSATGLTSADMDKADNDARTDDLETIGPGQIAEIRRLLAETGGSEESLCALIKAPSVDGILVGAYSTVIGLLEAKANRKKS